MTQSAQFDAVSVVKKANVYFDGKCVSHTVMFPDGTRKSVGVILLATLTFNTGVPETMDCVAGRCRIRLTGENEGPITAPASPSRCRAIPASTSRRWSLTTTSAISADAALSQSAGPPGSGKR